MHVPELLAPAGTYKNMRYAFAYGADAVYAGQPRYSLRVRNNEFNDMEIMADAISEAHDQGKKFYLASNVSPHNNKVKTYLRDLAPVVEMQPDALIMADPGLIMLVRDKWPDLPIHLSVQANAVNYASVKFWNKMGLSRAILSRELALEEIAEIRDACPEMELEVFVHGALCIAYSGRCLLSGYITHRDPNQGACTNTCRWRYKAHETTTDDTGDLKTLVTQTQPPSEEPGLWRPQHEQEETPAFLLEEENRPGELMPAFEDEHGTYIMNSRDLRAVQHVEALTKMGIHSLKIEGRTKTYYYAARTAQVYRRAIDDAVAGREFNMHLLNELEGLANRGYTEGFYRRHPPADFQNYVQGVSKSERQQYVGDIIDDNGSMLTVAIKNGFNLGDQLELLTPQRNYRFKLEALERLDGTRATRAPGSGHTFRITRPDGLPQASAYSLLLRDLP